MKYDWYSIVRNTDNLTQGDIIKSCPIPIPAESLYRNILTDIETATESIDVTTADLVVLTQACDLEHVKVESIVLCAVWSLQQIVSTNEYYRGRTGRESLRQGKEPAYHLLDCFRSDDIEMEYSVVDFHRIYTLPKEFLKSVAKSKEVRLRILPPYREHLSQSFARYFMRVGLPSDIDKEALTQFTSEAKITS